ncbi:exodeoxyribonuclease VII small subunit [Haploplasma modicum]|jgi:exodeoxyribonuclease VII small subunit|uniref:exodeoxyribonuclease VII small subunit n=1 Tax=Haploplasma modicum TaxID=2150 RepID=UPI00047ED373|nr:exodeoxyribonuclease VII small subunit [Haploplasma modicum]MCR1808752.1 exodeoxyribonuclease VII small subunit [Haploplasma modicum]
MENKSFEVLMAELEQLVKELENKDIPLDDAVKKYQKGLELTKVCHQMLKDAEEVIVKEVKE